MTPILLKVTLIWTLALAAQWALRRSSAAMRHLICATALLAGLAMPLSLLVPAKLAVVPVPYVFSASASAATLPQRWQPESLLLPLWALGAVLILGRVAIGFWRVRVFRQRARRVGAAGAVPIFEADIQVPVAVGLAHPAILLPASASSWPDEYRDAALRHEAAHIERKDLWTNLLAHVACAVYWFHPLVWAVARRLREEQELACDDAAVTSGTPPTLYAEALLAAARLARPPQVTSMIGCRMISRTSLKNRIARLADLSLPRTSSTSALRRTGLAVAVAAIGVGVVSALPQTPAPPAPAAPAPAPVFRAAATPEPAPQVTPMVVAKPAPQSAPAPAPTPSADALPSPTPDANNVYRVGPGVTAPRLRFKADPEYTEEARDAKIEGTVLLQIVVGADGLAHHISILKSLDGGLDIKAVEAAQKWTFEPGTISGVPVDVRAQIEMNFKLK